MYKSLLSELQGIVIGSSRRLLLLWLVGVIVLVLFFDSHLKTALISFLFRFSQSLKCLWSKNFFCVFLKLVVSWLRNDKRNSTKPTKTAFFLPPNNLKIHQIVSRGLGTSLCFWQRWWRSKCLEELLLLTYQCKRPLFIHSVLSFSWISS